MKASILKKIIKEELAEALGVPSDITSASTKLYNDFLRALDLSKKDTFGPASKFTIKRDYSFADIKIKGIILTLLIEKKGKPIVTFQEEKQLELIIKDELKKLRNRVL